MRTCKNCKFVKSFGRSEKVGICQNNKAKRFKNLVMVSIVVKVMIGYKERE